MNRSNYTLFKFVQYLNATFFQKSAPQFESHPGKRGELSRSAVFTIMSYSKMGVRAEALTDHRVPDYRDDHAVISLLVPTLPACLAVEQFWRATENGYSGDTSRSWRAFRRNNPTVGEFLAYYGPAGFSIVFGEKVACIGGPCRWSGFCTMASLQSIHAEAFRVIAHAIGGTTMVLHADDEDPVHEAALYDGSSVAECIAPLANRLGPAQPSIAIVSEDVQVYYKLKQRPWFLEELA
jgi:hypothetical protein